MKPHALPVAPGACTVRNTALTAMHCLTVGPSLPRNIPELLDAASGPQRQLPWWHL